MNQITILGFLGRDPEIRFTNSGTKVTNLNVATNKKEKGKEIVTWWRVVLWGDGFDKIIQWFKKGSGIIVMGELKPPKIYINKLQEQNVSLEIVAYHINFLPSGDGKKKEENKNQNINIEHNDPFPLDPDPFPMENDLFAEYVKE